MLWISASQLEAWARSVPSRTDLPLVVSDLIRASAPDLSSIRFPSGDKGQVRGFDGHLVSAVTALNIPEGRSYWEFGTADDSKAKMKGDFVKRSGQVEQAEQTDTTFVFVSPRTWDSSDPANKLEDFVAELKKAAHWKDVRFLDGAMLETWLQDNPAVSAWHAKMTLKVRPVDDIKCTEEFWDDFSGRYKPRITEDVLLCDRAEAAQQLVSELLTPSHSVQIVGDSSDEVLAFAIAAIRKAPPEVRLLLEAKTLVVESVAAGRNLLSSSGLVLLLRNDAARSPAQFGTIGTTLTPLGRAPRGTNITTLTRPTAYTMGVAMTSMGLPEGQAIAYARGAGRSLTALERLIPSGATRSPAWLHEGRKLLPALLAGGWTSSNNRDEEIICQLAGGVACSQIESHARDFLSAGDPPLDLEGNAWKVRAPMDAFMHIGPLIGRTDADLLRQALATVFSEIIPDPDPNEPVRISRSSHSVYSEWLRDGLATTLLLFAVWGDIANVNLGNETGQEFADRVLRDIPNLSSDPRILSSLQNELPLLAEAAPNPLLSALEGMLEGSKERLASIFIEQPGWLYPVARHTGLLWALEVLAWDPEFFPRATKILARLAEIDPGGQLSNRPQRSLTEIFVLWNPNTNASLPERIAALDQILHQCPAVGWRLLVSLLPSYHGVSTPTAKPKLREAGAADRSTLTYKELWESQAVVVDRAIDFAGIDLEKWSELVGHFAAFGLPERARAIEALDTTFSRNNDLERKPLWTKLRDEVLRHERFNQAEWALKGSDLDDLKSLVEKYSSTDPFSVCVRLFDRAVADLGKLDENVKERQIYAVRELYEREEAAGIIRLSQSVELPHLVINALDQLKLAEGELHNVLDLSLQRQPSSHFTMLAAALYYKVAGEQRAEFWISQITENGVATPQIIAEVLLNWPDGRRTWRLARKLSPDIEEAYWTLRSPYWVNLRRVEFIEALLMLLRYGRYVQALRSCSDRVDEVPTRLLFEILDKSVGQINSEKISPDGMMGYYLEQVFASLDKRPAVEAVQIATREYVYFSLLEHQSRRLRLYEVLAKDPAFFSRMVCNVYLGKGEQSETVDPDREALARHSYSILSRFKTFPWFEENQVNSNELESWISQVLALGDETGRRDVTEMYVGRILAHAPHSDDGLWPSPAVCKIIEKLASETVETEIQAERFNMRGAFTKTLYEGGKQERVFAETARRWVAGASPYPRTTRLLRSIADMWEDQAKRADLFARQQMLKS